MVLIGGMYVRPVAEYAVGLAHNLHITDNFAHNPNEFVRYMFATVFFMHHTIQY